MIETSDGESFPAQPVDMAPIDRQAGAKDLQCDRSPQIDLLREPHDGHAAPAELSLETKAVELHARGQRRRARRDTGEAGLDHLQATLEAVSVLGRNLFEVIFQWRNNAPAQLVRVVRHETVHQIVELSCHDGSRRHRRPDSSQNFRFSLQ